MEKRVPLGEVGAAVMRNVAEIRQRKRMTYQALSVRLQQLGRPIPTLGLSRIERGERRVDADDLVALSRALETDVSVLLGQEFAVAQHVTIERPEFLIRLQVITPP
jgi:transcriptional regulator with XRE-family HTH domain